MLLSEADIARLERAGYVRREFVHIDKRGYARLRNVGRYCVFYDAEEHRCRAYKLRPSGCRIYPVIYSEEDGIIADSLCPMSKTVSQEEIKRKGRKVIRLLKTIDREAQDRRDRVQRL